MFCADSEFEGLRSQKLEESLVFIEKYVFYTFVSNTKRNIETNEVGFRFHELSLGQNVPLDCGINLGQFLANNSRNTRESRGFSPGRGSKIPGLVGSDA